MAKPERMRAYSTQNSRCSGVSTDGVGGSSAREQAGRLASATGALTGRGTIGRGRSGRRARSAHGLRVGGIVGLVGAKAEHSSATLLVTLPVEPCRAGPAAGRAPAERRRRHDQARPQLKETVPDMPDARCSGVLSDRSPVAPRQVWPELDQESGAVTKTFLATLRVAYLQQ